MAVGGGGVASPPSAHQSAAVGQLSAHCQTPPPPNDSAAAAATSAAHRYRGTVDGVGGEARKQKINGPPHAIAQIDGVKVGGGGGVLL